MKIGGWQKISLIDYPGKISTIVFTQGCSFACGYCHNPELVIPEQFGSLIKQKDFFDYLKKRQGKLDAVVITGGDPILQPDLLDFMNKIKKLNYLIKLDTTGIKPDLIKAMIKQKLVDYIAMDIKAPLDKYHTVTNRQINTNLIKKSIDLLINSQLDYEFRTTIVKNQLSLHDFEKIALLIKGAKKYFLQKFVSSKTIDPKFMEKTTYDQNTLDLICEIMSASVQECHIR